MTPEQLVVKLGRVEAALASRAATAAANAMAGEFQRELVGVTLRRSTHPKGTRTPAAPGSPPALVTGTLRRSVRIVPAVSAGPRASAEVRAGTVYARIQELGGVVKAKRAPYLRFRYGGAWVQKKQVRLPARPYMKPTLAALAASGQLRRVAADAVKIVVDEAGS